MHRALLLKSTNTCVHFLVGIVQATCIRYSTIMHQSIPAVPIPPPPRVTMGHLLTLSVPGVGHSQFYRGPGGWALAYFGATTGHLTRAFSKDEFIGKDEAFVKD